MAINRRQLSASREPKPGQRGSHRLDVDCVSHQRVVDRERAGPGARHPEHDDFVMFELDAGRRASATGPQGEIRADVGLAQLCVVDLSERNRDPQRTCGARQAHRLEGLANRNAGSPAFGLGDTLSGKQRTFDLDVVHIRRIGNRSRPHC